MSGAHMSSSHFRSEHFRVLHTFDSDIGVHNIGYNLYSHLQARFWIPPTFGKTHITSGLSARVRVGSKLCCDEKKLLPGTRGLIAPYRFKHDNSQVWGTWTAKAAVCLPGNLLYVVHVDCWSDTKSTPSGADAVSQWLALIPAVRDCRRRVPPLFS